MVSMVIVICERYFYLDTVTIAPGVTTGQLMQFFLDNEVTFKSDVILPSVTYGGVFSGGCHVSEE